MSRGWQEHCKKSTVQVCISMPTVFLIPYSPKIDCSTVSQRALPRPTPVGLASNPGLPFHTQISYCCCGETFCISRRPRSRLGRHTLTVITTEKSVASYLALPTPAFVSQLQEKAGLGINKSLSSGYISQKQGPGIHCSHIPYSIYYLPIPFFEQRLICGRVLCI